METNKAPKDVSSKIQSSCELCQRRKVRCDKANPCSTCRRAGVKCEVSARQRLPRGRNGGRRKGDTDLKARIAKLENLVLSLGDKTPDSNSPAAGSGPVRDEVPQKEPSSDMSRYLGSSFWSNLTSEVHGLREVLDDTSESDSETPERSEPTSTPPSQAAKGFNFVLCGPDSFMMSPNALDNPSSHMVEMFHTLYFQNVDPLFKILHAPSVAEYTLRGKPYLGHKPSDPAIEALSFAIYYAGLNTLDARICKHQFGEEKTELLHRYRFAFEVCLARADFINSMTIEVLQAFVIFLASVRVNDRSRWSWTLLALAVRMAQALGLHTQEGPSSRTPFEIEMRRRLWHQLGVLDINASVDRGTDPMLAGKIKGVSVPANVNDSEISPDMETPIISREGFTDMSFCLMGYDGEPMIKKLVYVQGGETEGERLEIEQTWHKRTETVQGFVQSMNDKYTRYCNTDIPFHWFAKRVSEIMGSGLMLYAIRPMQLHPQIKAPPMEEFNVLNIAVDILAKHQTVLTTPFTEPWRWFVWVQWHPLAVALAELCSRTEGSDVDRAWGVVDVAFQRYADLVADTERGMLWSPIEKLMKKARQNKRMAAMAKLSLRDQKEPFANIPAPLPGPANRSEAPRTASDMKGQTSRPYPDTLRNMPVNPHTDGWNARIFAPDSIASNTPSMPDTMEGLTSTPNLNTAPLLMNSTPFSGVGDAASFPLDMAWNNWEDFVGEVNFADFDLSDPMVGFPQP